MGLIFGSILLIGVGMVISDFGDAGTWGGVLIGLGSAWFGVLVTRHLSDPINRGG